MSDTEDGTGRSGRNWIPPAQPPSVPPARPDGPPFQYTTPTPPIAPPQPPKRKRRVLWIALVVALIAIGLGLFGPKSLFERSKSASIGQPGTPRVQVPAIPAQPAKHNVSGTVTLPGSCGPVKLSVGLFDVSKKPLGSGAVSTNSSKTTCSGTFSFSISTSSTYRVLMLLKYRGGHVNPLSGPILTATQLVDDGYKITLTPESFGLNSDDLRVKQDLTRAIAAVNKFAKQNGDSFSTLTPEAMHRLIPALTFNSDPTASEGEISMHDVTPTTVVFTEKSASGTNFCFGQSTKTPKSYAYGEIDAQTYAACLAWQPSGGPGASGNPVISQSLSGGLGLDQTHNFTLSLTTFGKRKERPLSRALLQQFSFRTIYGTMIENPSSAVVVPLEKVLTSTQPVPEQSAEFETHWAETLVLGEVW